MKMFQATIEGKEGSVIEVGGKASVLNLEAVLEMP